MKENEIEVWGTTEAQDVSSNAVNSQGEKCRIVRTYDYYPDAQEIHEHVSIQNAVSIKLVEFNAYKAQDLIEIQKGSVLVFPIAPPPFLRASRKPNRM